MMKLLRFFTFILITCATVQAEDTVKPVPLMQVFPQPYDQISIQRNGIELTRYHFGASLNRPFLYPVIGPAGVSLTRMGHPHDPNGHSHHNSVWISHNSVNGLVFWGDTGEGKIRHKRFIDLIDSDQQAVTITENAWVNGSGETIMTETRRISAINLTDGEWLLSIDLTFQPNAAQVVLGQTPFGMTGVRMAKSIGVHDGGGMIRNSEGGVNEEGVFWKPARWVDYSGAVTNEKREGITLFDHPKNPNHPSVFHVRNDGWMGASLTFDATRTIQVNETLELRYGLYVHNDSKEQSLIDEKWRWYSQIETPE